MTDPKNAPETRRTLSLGNQDSNMGTSLQQLHPVPSPTRDVNKIRTFFIWSIFNLLLIPFGILCCYLSHKASQFKRENRFEKATKWSKRAFVGNVISTLTMGGVIVTIVMLHYDYVQNNPSQVNQTRTTGAYIPWQPGR